MVGKMLQGLRIGFFLQQLILVQEKVKLLALLSMHGMLID
jgi:hypothetical protein